MLSIVNEIDPCLLLPLCVLYEIQNQIFQHFEGLMDQRVALISGVEMGEDKELMTSWERQEVQVGIYQQNLSDLTR